MLRQLACLLLFLFPLLGHAQQEAEDPSQTENPQSEPSPRLRLERTRISGDAELLTVWANAGPDQLAQDSDEIPLLTVLRDTLGGTAEGEVLRQVWVHSFTRPGVLQRMAALVPFLYKGFASKPHVRSGSAPAAVMDLARVRKDVWHNLIASSVTNIALPDAFARASGRTYWRNSTDYRRAHIDRAIMVLGLYGAEAAGDESALNQWDLGNIEARLMLSEKLFGGLVDQRNLRRVYEKQTSANRDARAHNWELLRQQAEAGGLFFEPLAMPESAMTHAILWIAQQDVHANWKRPFDGRFLNIQDPWRDKRLLRWKGYSQIKYFDDDNRPVDQATPEAHAVEMIPLALYGLDFEKIPALLIDFRDGWNPRKRELSRRVLDDVVRNVLTISRFGNFYYFFGRTGFDFVTGRRGVDLNQRSRLRGYAELKLLLAFNPDFSPALAALVQERLQTLSLNPLENDARAERQLALEHYQALLAYAQRPDGLPARLQKERRSEMTRFSHGKAERAFLQVAHVATLGQYTHREEPTPEKQEKLNQQRELAFHTEFLREVADSSPRVEIVWDINEVRRSLRYIVENASVADDAAVDATARLFAHTEDDAARALSLEGLYRIDSKSARKQLMRMYRDERLEAMWRDMIAAYLDKTARNEQRIARSNADLISSSAGAQ